MTDEEIRLSVNAQDAINNLNSLIEKFEKLGITFKNLSNKELAFKINIPDNIERGIGKIKELFDTVKHFSEQKLFDLKPMGNTEKFFSQLQSIERETNKYVDNINKSLRKIEKAEIKIQEGNLTPRQESYQKGQITAFQNKINNNVGQLQQLYSVDNLEKIQKIEGNIYDIVSKNIDLQKQGNEIAGRLSNQEKESLKTTKELIEYQREKNKLEQISLENETLKNKLISSGKEVAKISTISDIDKQSKLGLAKLDVSNKDALLRESTGNEPLKIRLSLQNDLNSALKTQLNIEKEILKEEKKEYQKYLKNEQGVIEQSRQKESDMYKEYLAYTKTDKYTQDMDKITKEKSQKERESAYTEKMKKVDPLYEEKKKELDLTKEELNRIKSIIEERKKEVSAIRELTKELENQLNLENAIKTNESNRVATIESKNTRTPFFSKLTESSVLALSGYIPALSEESNRYFGDIQEKILEKQTHENIKQMGGLKFSDPQKKFDANAELKKLIAQSPPELDALGNTPLEKRIAILNEMIRLDEKIRGLEQNINKTEQEALPILEQELKLKKQLEDMETSQGAKFGPTKFIPDEQPKWSGSKFTVKPSEETKAETFGRTGEMFKEMAINKQQIRYSAVHDQKFMEDKEWEERARQVEKNITTKSKDIDKINEKFQSGMYGNKQSLQSLTTDINLAGNALNLFGQYLFSIGKAAIEEAAEWEVLRIKLATFTNSAEEAHSRFKELVTLGLTTPFEVKGLIQAEILLRSFGNETKDLLPRVVDLAAAMGKDVDKAAYAVARAMSGASLGFLMLQKTWGVSYAKLRELGAEFRANGQIVASSVKTQNALSLALDTLNGSAERLSRTYKGQLSNLSDALSVLRESAGKTLLPLAKEGVEILRQLFNYLNNVPDVTKQIVVSIAGVMGAISLLFGGLSNTIWQLGNFAQGIDAIPKLIPTALPLLSRLGLVAAEAGAGLEVAAGSSIALATAWSPLVIGAGLVAGAIYLIVRSQDAYIKQQKQMKDDEIALREQERNTILAELDSKLHGVVTAHDAYNKIMNTGAIELSVMVDKEKMFSEALQLQAIEIGIQQEKVNELRVKWEEAQSAKKKYEEGKLGETELKPEIVKGLNVAKNVALKPAFSLATLPYDMMNMVLNPLSIIDNLAGRGKHLIIKEQTEATEKSLAKQKEITDYRDKRLNEVRDELISLQQLENKKQTPYGQTRIKQLQNELKILDSQNYVTQQMTQWLETQNNKLNDKLFKEQQVLESMKKQTREIEYQQKEAQRLADTYGTVGSAIQDIINQQKDKKGIRPEIVAGVKQDLLEAQANLKTNVSPEEEKWYRGYKAQEQSYYKQYGSYPGQMPVGDTKKRIMKENNWTEEQFNAHFTPEELQKYKDDFDTKRGGVKDKERFAQIQSQIEKKDIINKNLEMVNAFAPDDAWKNYDKIKQEYQSKPFKDKPDERAAFKAKQEAWDMAWDIDWNKFNEKEQEGLATGEVTKKQHLDNLKKFLDEYDGRLADNLPKHGQMWKMYAQAEKEYSREHAKVAADMEKDIAAATPSKLDDIEAQKKASIIALNQEFEVRQQLEGRSVTLLKWYAAQRKTIEQKSHEDTLKEMDAEYTERIEFFERAQVAETKLGSFQEKRAQEEARYQNERVKAEAEYLETKERLIKEAKFADLADLEIAYLGESRKRNEQHLENIKKLAMEELQVRMDLENTVAEHKRKMGEITDKEMLTVQKKSAEVMVASTKAEAVEYEKMAENGVELNDLQKQILSTYQSQEEKLKEINTTLEYRLNAEGQIYDVAYKTFNERLNLHVAEKGMIEDVAQAYRISFVNRQIEYEKGKFAILEQKEATDKITDAERGILSEMRQRKTEYANMLSSLSGFTSKVRSAVDQAVQLQMELKYGANYTGVMSDKFKSAYEHAKALLETVKTMGNITAGGNAFGNLGEFSTLNELVASQSKFGKDVNSSAKWKAELAMKQGTTSTETDPQMAARKALEDARKELQQKIEKEKMTDAAMESAKGQLAELDKQYAEGIKSGTFNTDILKKADELSTQSMTVNVQGDVSINGETSDKGGVGGTPTGAPVGSEAWKKEQEEKKKKEQEDKNKPVAPATPATAKGDAASKGIVGGGDSASANVTNPTPSAIAGDPSSWLGRHNWVRNEGDGIVSKHALTGEESLAETLGLDKKDIPALFDNPSNDAGMENIGRKWTVRALKTLGKNTNDMIYNFMKGTVNQMKDTNQSLSNNYDNRNQSSSNQTINHYSVNVDGKTIQGMSGGNNGFAQKTRGYISAALAAKNSY